MIVMFEMRIGGGGGTVVEHHYSNDYLFTNADIMDVITYLCRH